MKEKLGINLRRPLHSKLVPLLAREVDPPGSKARQVTLKDLLCQRKTWVCTEGSLTLSCLFSGEVQPFDRDSKLNGANETQPPAETC